MAVPKLISRRYEVLELLGQGGMGTVYKVRHTALGSISALKILPPELMKEPEMVTRFYREARIMANLSHPNIVRVLDIDHDDAMDFHYFVMEYIEGETLRRYVDRKRSLSLTETLDVGGQVARALAYAHGHVPPIIHRDVKPSNIMIEGSSRRVVVMDFGIAKELDGSELTRPGVTVGTLKYCAPEQMRQEKLDGAVDVYALGMVMHEAYTGSHLFAGLGERELVARVLIEKGENEPRFGKQTPPAFAALVAKAIAKSRQSRYPTMAAFLRDLETCEDDSGATPGRATGTTGRFRPRLVASREATPGPLTELKDEWRDAAATKPKSGPTPDLKHQVEELRTRTGQLRGATASLRGTHRDRAERGWRRAEKLLDEGRLAEAKTGFEEAATLFSALQSRLEQEGVTGTPPPVGAAEHAREDEATVVTPAPRSGSAAAQQRPVESRPKEPPPAPATAPAARAAKRPREDARQAKAAAATSFESEPTLVPGAERGVEAGGAGSTRRRRPLVAVLAGGILLLGIAAIYLASGDGGQEPGASAGASAVAQAPATGEGGAAVAPVEVATGRERGAAAAASSGREAPPAGAGPEAAAGGRSTTAAEAATGADGAGPSAGAEAEPAAADGAVLAENPDDGSVAALPPDVGVAAPDGMVVPGAARFSELERIVRYTRNPTVDLKIPVGDNVLAALDERPLDAASDGVVTGRLTGLPVGESEHVLRLTSPDGAGVQEIPVAVTYYPGWEIRRFGDVAGEAYAVAFSPDGSRVVAGTRNNQIRMWDVGTGELLRTFSGHNDWVNDVAFSPEGGRILSGSKDRTLKLWDADTGAELQSFEGHKGWVNGVAFSPDGSEAASVSDDRTVRIWNVATGEELASLVGHRDWILAVTFSPDGKRVASGGRDKVVRVWDLETGELLQTLTGHRDWVNAVVFSPDGRTVASASDDQRIRIWDVETGELVRTLTGHGGWVVALSFSPDGRRLVSASKDQTVRLWDVATGKEVRTFSGHRGLVGDVAFGPDGRSAVSGGRDRTLRLWWTASEPTQGAAEVEKERDSG